MSDRRSSAVRVRLITVITLAAVAALTLTAAGATTAPFAFIDQVKEYFGLESTQSAVLKAAPELAATNQNLAEPMAPAFFGNPAVPISMSVQPSLTYSENFALIATWTSNFAAGTGSGPFGSVAINASGTLGDGVKTTVSSATFSSGTTGGVQQPAGIMHLLSTGTANAVAVDFFADFSGVNAGTISFDVAQVANSTGDRDSRLKLFYSTNGTTFTEITGTNLPFTARNNVASSASISVPVPAALNGVSTARFRFYEYSLTTGATPTGSQPKISVDNLVVTATAVSGASFYSASTGNLDDVNTWWSNTDGATGTHPTNFTSAGQVFNIRNRATATTGGAWTVSGSGSKVVVGDGTNACNFTIPSGSGLTGTVDVSAAATLTIQSTSSPTFGTLAATSTVDYAGTGAQAITATNYGNLTLSNSGSLSLSGTAGISGTFTPGSSPVTAGTFDFNGSGAQTIPAFNYPNLTSSSTGARTLASSGTIGISGTFTPGTNSYTNTGSTIDFNGSGSQTINAFNYNNLTISGSRGVGTVTLASGTIDIAGAFSPTATFSSGNYSITGNTIRFSSAGSQNIPAFNFATLTNSNNGPRVFSTTGTIGIATALTTNGSAFTVTDSTVNFNGTAGATIAGTNSYHHLIISGTGTYTFSANNTIAGDFSQTAASTVVVNASTARTLTIGGNVALSAGTFILGNASGNTSTAVNVTGNVTVSGTGKINLEAVNSTSGAATLNVGGNFTSTGTTVASAGANGVVDFGASGTVTGNAINITGNFSKSGTGTFGTAATTPSSGFVFTGGGSHTFSYSGADSQYVQYAVNSGNTLTMSTGLNLVSGTNPRSTFTVNGTIDFGTQVLAAAGSSSDPQFSLASGGTLRTGNATGINGSITLPGTKTFDAGATYVYNGAVNQAVGALLPASVANLTIANTGGSGNETVTGNSGQTVTGLLRVQSGIYSAASTYNNFQIDPGATYNATGAVSVSGNWTNNGTFTANGNGVTLNGSGAQAVNGSTTFYDLTAAASTARTLTFEAGKTQTVSNSFSLNGAAGQLLSLRSSASPTQWLLSAPSTQSVSYVDVKDSNASGGNLVNHTNSVSSGNNLNWAFSSTITASSGSGGSVTPSGATVVAYNGSQGYVIAPDSGFHIVDVLVDSVSQGAITNYTFSNVTADHTISATFAINTYTITASSGGNGSVSPNGATIKNHGENQAYTITADSGYAIDTVLVDGVNNPAAVTSGTYTFSNIQANHTISATFTPTVVNRTVTFDANGGTGSMTPQVASTTTALTANSFTRTGYTFANWNTAANGSGTTYANGADYNFAADITLYAQWTADPPTAGTYADASVPLGGWATVTITAAPTNTTTASATATGFDGVLRVDPATGILRVTNASHAGAYPVNVKFFGPGGSVSRSFVLTVTTPAVCGNPQFNTGADTATGTDPNATAVGDFNGDNNQDLAVANSGSSNVSILLGDGLGGFTAAPGSPVSTSAGPSDVITVDLNRDGNLDIVTANQLASNVGLYYGNGSGGFTFSANLSTPAGPYSVAAGDLNGDGYADLVSANGSATNISVFIGTSSGFLTGVTYTSGNTPYSVAIGDLNNDGKQDVVTANFVANTISTFTGTGTGTLNPGVSTFVGTSPTSVAIGNLNTDGNADVVVANNGGTTVSVLLGDGAGGYLGSSPYSVGDTPFAVAIADINSDGKNDVVTSNNTSLTAKVLYGNGFGSLTALTTLSPGTGTRSIAVGDFTNDNRQDLVVTRHSSNVITTYTQGACGAEPTFSISDVSHNEGNAGTANYQFVITKSGFSTIGSSVDYNTADGSAVAPDDYTGIGTTTANFGQAATVWNVFVVVKGDTTPETDEDFTVHLSNPTNGTISDADGTGTIVNDDATLYTVTFNANGGSGTMANQTSATATNLNVNTFTRVGYTFAGWGTAQGGPVVYADQASYPFTANVTLYAQWTIISYPLTYTAGANGSLTGSTSQNVNYGSAGTAVTAVPNTGYHFVDWTPGNSIANPRTDTNITGPASYTANFAINNYAVTFNSNGGSSVTTQNIDHGSLATEPTAPTKTGYTFAGWYTDDVTFLNAYSFATQVTGAITLYAKWTINQYTVTFDANGGAGTMAAQTRDYNDAFALTSNSFTRVGYTFSGWNTAANGSGTAYANNAVYPFTESTTLYAQWTSNATHTVTYAAGTGGSGTAPTQGAVAEGDTFVVAANTFTRSGYHFTGWFDGTSTYQPTDVYTMGTSDVTLTAQWAIDACVSPSTVYVDASWSSAVADTDPDGAGPATRFGCDSFATVAGGIGGVANNGSVMVAAGDYTESGQIVVNKNVSVIGADRATTFVRPGTDTGSSGDSRGWFLVNAAKTFNVSGVTFDGTNKKVWHALRYHGSGTINNVAFANLKFEASGPAYQGGAVFTDTGVVDVTNSTFAEIGRVGVLAGSSSGPGGTGTIGGNTYTGKGAGDWLDYAFDIEYGSNYAITNNTVTGNVGIATVDSSDSAGISVWGDPGTTANLTGNTITGNSTGVALAMVGENSPTVTINSTTISGGAYGVGIQDVFGPGTPTLTITNSAITNNSAAGIFIAAGMGLSNITVSGTRIADNGAAVLSGGALVNSHISKGEGREPKSSANRASLTGEINMENNWWGCNEGPNTPDCSTVSVDVDYDPWIVLSTSAASNPINPLGTSVITADMTKNSANVASGVTLLPLPVDWTATQGGMSPPSGTVTSGLATSTFTSNSNNDGSACAAVDNEQVCSAIDVTSYTVTYFDNGSTSGAVPNDSSSPYANGASVTVLGQGSLLRTNYTFAGWNTESDGSGISYNPAQTFNITSNTSLYAQWTLDTYSLSYDGNGNTGGTAPAGGTFGFGTSQTVASVGSLVKTNYTFTGWNTASDGSGTSYSAGSSYVIPAANTILYAQWQLNSYTINASAGANGTISPNGAVSVNHGANQTFTFTPASGYNVSSVTVDSVPVPVASSYTFTNVTTGHTIAVTFSQCAATSTVNQNAYNGANVVIPVTTSDITSSNVISAQFTFTYDPAVLSPNVADISVTPGTVLPTSPAPTIDINANTPGTIYVSVYGTSVFSGSGTVVNINMKVIGLAPATSPLTLSDFLFNGGYVCSDTTSGTLSVVLTPQTITVGTPAPSTAAYGSTFNVAASASSGLPVAITVTGGCDVTGGGTNSATITMNSSTVACVVHYNQSGNAVYAAAPEVTSTTNADKATSTVTVDALTVVYDGDSHPTTATVSGVGAGITQTVTWAYTGNCSAAPRNVSQTPCTATATYAGDANHYGSNGSNTITITKRPITVTAADDSKVYDGTTSSSATPIITGTLGTGDTAGFTQAFTNRNVGTGKTLVPTGIVNDTDSGNNYNVTFVNSTNGEITAKPITVTAVSDTKVYDGTNTSAGSPSISPGLGVGDTSGFTQSFDDENVGTGKTLTATGTVNDGNSGNNYSVSFVTDTTGVITARPITVTAATNTKVYDGTTSAAAIPTITLGTLAPGDTAGFVEAYSNRDVGTSKTLIPSGSVLDGNSGNNYSVTFVNDTTGVISALAITVTAVVDTKVYDGTTSSTGVPTIAPPLASGDTTGFIQTFDTRNVGSGKTLTPSGSVNDGNSGSNYSVSFVTVSTGTITAKPISVSAVPDTKVYDGTTSSAGTPSIVPGLGAGDTSGFTQTFDTRDVGSGKTLTASGSVNDGNSGNNYSVTFFTVGSGVITARPITVTAATDTKEYDGSNSSAGIPTITLGSLASPDTAVFSQTFDNKNVGTSKTLTPTGTITDGNGGNNYSVIYAVNTTGVITAKAATWTTNPASKSVGDADPIPLTTGSGTGFLPAEYPNVSATYSRVSGETVGTYQITATLSATAPVDLNNYSITNAGALFTINDRTLTGLVTYRNAATPPVPVPDVTITASGALPIPTAGTTLTDGTYSMNGFGPGTYTLTPSKPDQSCSVHKGIYADDASQISRFVVHLEDPTLDQIEAGKVAGLPNMTSFDAALVAQYTVCIGNPLNQTGKWKFTPTNLVVLPGSVQNFSGILKGDVNGSWTDAGPRPAVVEDINTAVRASIPNVQVAAGTSVNVPLRLDNLRGQSIGSYQFDIEYDPAVIEPATLAASLTGTVGESMNIVSNSPTPGLLKVAVYGAMPINGDGVYANLHFAAIGGAGTMSGLHIRAFRYNEGDSAVYSVNGSVSIASTNDAAIRGRLLTATGMPVSNTRVVLTSTTGSRFAVQSNSFGYFEFGGLSIGESYTVSVRTNRFVFAPVTVSAQAGVTELQMIAEQ